MPNMPNTPRRALIVIDVQNDYVGGNLPIEFPDVNESLGHIAKAIDAARDASVPVVVVQSILPAGAPIMARGTPGADLHEVVRSRPWDHYIQKDFPSAFTGTDLFEWLGERKIDTIAVVGYMTHNCDFATIIHAAHAGLSAEFLADAAGSVPYENRAGRASAEELHRAFVVVLQSRFAAVMSTDEWIDALKTGVAPQRDSIVASNRRARCVEVR